MKNNMLIAPSFRKLFTIYHSVFIIRLAADCAAHFAPHGDGNYISGFIKSVINGFNSHPSRGRKQRIKRNFKHALIMIQLTPLTGTETTSCHKIQYNHKDSTHTPHGDKVAHMRSLK